MCEHIGKSLTLVVGSGVCRHTTSKTSPAALRRLFSLWTQSTDGPCRGRPCRTESLSCSPSSGESPLRMSMSIHLFILFIKLSGVMVASQKVGFRSGFSLRRHRLDMPRQMAQRRHANVGCFAQVPAHLPVCLLFLPLQEGRVLRLPEPGPQVHSPQDLHHLPVSRPLHVACPSSTLRFLARFRISFLGSVCYIE